MPWLPASAKAGRPWKSAWRAILHAVFSGRRTGCHWRFLPPDFPHGQTAYHSLRAWRHAGTWKRLHERWRERLRMALGREAQPRAGVRARQSVKTTGVGGERGDDGAKQLKGRKRHLLVDTHGLVLPVNVPPAGLMARDGVTRLWPPAPMQAAFPRLTHGWREAGDHGTDHGREGIEPHWGWTTQVVKPPARRVLVAAHVAPPTSGLSWPR